MHFPGRRFALVALLTAFLAGLAACGTPKRAGDARSPYALVAIAEIPEDERQARLDFRWQELSTILMLQPTQIPLVKDAVMSTWRDDIEVIEAAGGEADEVRDILLRHGRALDARLEELLNAEQYSRWEEYRDERSEIRIRKGW